MYSCTECMVSNMHHHHNISKKQPPHVEYYGRAWPRSLLAGGGGGGRRQKVEGGRRDRGRKENAGWVGRQRGAEDESMMLGDESETDETSDVWLPWQPLESVSPTYIDSISYQTTGGRTQHHSFLLFLEYFFLYYFARMIWNEGLYKNAHSDDPLFINKKN